jgi:hypothetical protein
MINQGLDSLNNALKARLQGEAEGVDVSYVPPTEAEFAAAVAKDVAAEMLPPAQTIGIVLVVVAAVLVLIFWLSRKKGEAE